MGPIVLMASVGLRVREPDRFPPVASASSEIEAKMQTNRAGVLPIRHRSTRRRRLGGLGAAAMASLLAVAMSATATAATTIAMGATRGDPQPELALFNVGGSGGTYGSGVALPDGTLVLAALSDTGGSARVCMLHPGERSCAATSVLHTSQRDADFSGTAEVIGAGGRDVSVVLNDSRVGNIVYNSTNDGKSFSSTFVSAGEAMYGVASGTSIRGQLIVAAVDPHLGVQVQAFSATEKTPETAFANPSGDDYDTYVSDYKGGVLEASDNLSNTYVKYAPAGSDFNATSSYKSVGTFAGQQVSGLSGGVLLTDPHGSLTGGELLRSFNGTSFGAGHKVPEPSGGDDGYFTLQEVGGVVHVFFLNRRHGYDIYSETTTNGDHWSPRTIYNTAVTTGLLVPVLETNGTGVVYEASTGPKALLAQPILEPQSVRVSLKHSRVKAGTSTTLKGKASPVLKGQRVVLQRLSGGLWYHAGSTTESASGTFSFNVPGVTHTYRAVVADKVGYYLYGYSNPVTLTAVS
jgi:hypothetical protein